jgi:signal transduction histidine kinase
MSSPVWYRSLYWRIALGFVALLAVLLAAQGLVFLWLTGRVAAAWPGRSASELASSVAADLSRELAVHPDLDINEYVNSRFTSAFRSFAVVMRDGRAIRSRRVLPPPLIERAAWARLFGESSSAAFGHRGPPLDRPPASGDASGRRGFGRRDARLPDGGFGRADRPRGPGGAPDRIAYDFATVTVGGQDVGVVAVPVDPPPLSVAMQNLWPELLTVAFGLLVAGTATGALLVFRPTHRRLQALQESARAVGSGETGVRAPETGGDEVTAFARAFNEMAGQLEQRTQALEAIDRTRRQLVADISHELTTPLAAIRGYVETLSMPEVSLDDDTRARYLTVVGEETDRLEHIVGDLLDMARLEGGGATLAIGDVPVGQLFERLRHRHEQVLDQRSITLETSEASPGLIVRGDPKRLEQAVQNLVANATRHTPAGGRIVVSAIEKDEGVVLAVEDTGPGIPPEHLPRVFDRFYKVDVSRTGTALPSGSGLGLSIVRAIVERHGGTIAAGHASNGGARFEIWLPKAR